MRDPNFILLVAGSFVVFLAIALYAHQGVRQFARRARIAPPPPALILAVRVWFGALALGAVVLLLLPLVHGR